MSSIQLNIVSPSDDLKNIRDKNHDCDNVTVDEVHNPPTLPNGTTNMGFEDEVKKSQQGSNQESTEPAYTKLAVENNYLQHHPNGGINGSVAEEVDLGVSKELGMMDAAHDVLKDIDEEEELMKTQISTTRHVLNQDEFDELYDVGDRPQPSFKEMISSLKDSCECSGRCVKKKITGMLPFIKVFKNYSIKEDMLGDAVAGLTIGVMQIPQGMAYAMLASLPPQYGLYTSLFPVLLYFFFGTSRHVSVGTFAVVSLMVGSTVDKYCGDGGGVGEEGATTVSFLTTFGWSNSTEGGGGGDSELLTCQVGVATAVTFLGGIIQLLMALFRLGFVTIYLSEAMTRGFTTGCAIHVFSSQIKYVFGVDVGRYAGPWKLIYTYRDLILNLPETNPAALVLSIIFIVIIYITKEYLNPPVKKRIKAPIPIDLIMVIVGTLASALGDFSGRWGILVVGDIPVGFPPPQFPPVERFGDVFADAIAVAVVAFAISVSMVQLFARKHSYETDSNQELLAHGVCNSICSSLNCYMMCVSLSRSVVQEAIGCKSQIAALWSSSLIAITIIFIAQYFEQLPNCVLAAIIIVALKGMFMQFKDIPKYWKMSGVDMSVWLVSFIAVVLLDVGYGLVVGVIYSLLTVVGRTQRPYSAVEGRIPDTDIYKDTGVYSKAEELEKVKIFRFDGAIYFANCTYFVEQVYEKTECDAKRISLTRAKIENKKKKEEKRLEKVRKRNVPSDTENGLAKMEEAEEWVLPSPHIHHVVLDCTTVSYVDAMGVGVLRQVCSEYQAVGVTTFLAGCKAGVREMLVAGGFHEKFDKDILYPTVHDAVVAAASQDPVLIEELKMISPEVVYTEL